MKLHVAIDGFSVFDVTLFLSNNSLKSHTDTHTHTHTCLCVRSVPYTTLVSFNEWLPIGVATRTFLETKKSQNKRSGQRSEPVQLCPVQAELYSLMCWGNWI